MRKNILFSSVLMVLLSLLTPHTGCSQSMGDEYNTSQNNPASFYDPATGAFYHGPPGTTGGGSNSGTTGGNTPLATITFPNGVIITTDAAGNYNATNGTGACSGCPPVPQPPPPPQAPPSYAFPQQIFTYNYYYDYYAGYYYNYINNSSNTVPQNYTPPPPPSLQIDELSQACQTAELNGISTYVTPSGNLFSLPWGSKVYNPKNVDLDVLPNGALYVFTLPSNVTYGAYMSVVTGTAGTGIVSPVKFYGYFELNAQNQPDLSKPFPGNFSPPPPQRNADGSYNVVRMLRTNTPNGCKMTREVVQYTLPGDISASSTNADDYIKYAGAVAGLSNCVSAVNCPPQNNSAQTIVPTSETYKDFGAQTLSYFFRTKTKNSIKVFIYDCNTNKVQYTITKDAVQQVNGAQQDALMNDYNNGNLNTADIAIKACIQNGQWQYDAKFNRARLTPHPKVLPVLDAVIDEINKQANDEVKNLKTVHSQTREERYYASNGEMFYKVNMDLMKSLAAIYDVGKDIINDGKMPDKIWDRGFRNGPSDEAANQAHQKSPFWMPTYLGGGTDQLIDEATGTIQLVKTGYEFIRHPKQSLESVWNGVKSLNVEKIKQIAKDASGASNYIAGGDKGRYQAGKHSVQAAMILVTGIKNLTKGSTVVNDAGANVTDLQKFIPDGGTDHSVADALKNASENSKLVKNINNEKLITRNIQNGEEKIVAVEKNGATAQVFEAKKTDFIDENGNVLDDASIDNLLEEGAKEIDLPKTKTTVNGQTQIETNAGKSKEWNKGLNKPEPNTEYLVKNSGPNAHKYTTDANGRVSKVEGELALNSRDRNGYQQSVKCKGTKDGLATDQGGHLIGSRFDGAGEQINLVPMTSDLNLSQWKTMENNWQSLLEQTPPKNLKVKIEVKYEDPLKPLRPTRFIVTETIDGLPQSPKIFNN